MDNNGCGWKKLIENDNYNSSETTQEWLNLSKIERKT
jgi:hypothetical protein